MFPRIIYSVEPQTQRLISDTMPKNRVVKDSPSYQRYLQKYDADAPENIAKRKQAIRDRLKKWFLQNWIALFSLIAAFVSLNLRTKPNTAL